MLTHDLAVVGSRIRAARQAKHWTQAQLHIAAGVALGDISKIENGRLLAPSQLKRLTEALGLTEPGGATSEL
jgi:transcriptional regulator with XRE-family HTH domain